MEKEKSLLPLAAPLAAPQREEPIVQSAEEPEASGRISKRRAKPRRKNISASRDCILLAGAYLLGTFLAGVLQAGCDTAEQDTLSFYLHCWQKLFAASDPARLPQLFCAEAGTVLGALSVIFFLGLSALGPIGIFLFLMLYGTGSGLLFAQLMSGMNLRTFLVWFAAAGVPSAFAAGVLCLFGASALQVSSRIQNYSFGKGEGISGRAGARFLAGQYLVMATALLPLCGAASGLAYLACRFTG